MRRQLRDADDVDATLRFVFCVLFFPLLCHRLIRVNALDSGNSRVSLAKQCPLTWLAVEATRAIQMARERSPDEIYARRRRCPSVVDVPRARKDGLTVKRPPPSLAIASQTTAIAVPQTTFAVQPKPKWLRPENASSTRPLRSNQKPKKATTFFCCSTGMCKIDSAYYIFIFVFICLMSL